ncbi:sigma-70 family RNA polymerase sigma factor [Mesorhizobium sp. YM1C-6-2]|uniref:sigma-70 family RNA polymerase sigma factor n=1 Tax=Mesorhizobium sp. YM1C-6-2 TaxID=1827501 RepID=UPI0026A7EA4B
MGRHLAQAPSTVSIFSVADEWQVSVGESGREAVFYFMQENCAKSFATSQRSRLELSNSVPPVPANTNAMIVDLIPALRAFARTFYRDSYDADDLVQETLTKAIDNISLFAPGTRLKSWLFTIMRNTFLTKVKKYNRERPGDADCVSLEGKSNPAQEWSQAVYEVEAAMLRLPQDQREVLVLVAILGTGYEEAATICECAVGTIKSRLNRARAALLFELGGGTVAELLA